MMKTLTHKDIAIYLPYDLKWSNIKSGRIINMEYCYMVDETICIVDKKGIKYMEDIWPILPVLYPISCLTEPTKLEGYDEPVIPLVELAKIAFPSVNWQFNSNIENATNGEFYFGYNEDFYCSDGSGLATLHLQNQWQLFQFMAQHKIDFQGLIEQDLAVPVTEDFNPYV